MKVGDLVRTVTAKRSVTHENGFGRTMETYRLPEEEQRIGTVVKMGKNIKQMTVLTQEGKVKFWFNHQCEVVA
jgi:hypothetical protein